MIAAAKSRQQEAERKRDFSDSECQRLSQLLADTQDRVVELECELDSHSHLTDALSTEQAIVQREVYRSAMLEAEVSELKRQLKLSRSQASRQSPSPTMMCQ